MNLQNILHYILEYEETILLFVEKHYQEIQADWTEWLINNPILTQVMPRVGKHERIRLTDIARFRLETCNNQLQIHKIEPNDQEWFDSETRVQIELNAARSIDSDAIQNRETLYQLELVGVHHRLESCHKHNSLILHFDYLIEKVEIETPIAEIPLPPLPENFSQMTFIEARSLSVALADGPRLIGWESITGEIGLRHVNKNTPFQTRIMLDDVQREWQLPITCEDLLQELQNLEFTSLLLLNVAIGCVLEQPQMSASIDELMLLIGWRPRTRRERIEMRIKIWRWMLLFDSMNVHGRRPGKYRDKMTGKEFDLTSADALIKVTGKRFQREENGDFKHNVPLEVSWVAGPWLDQWRNNSQILSYFGDLRKVASIPTGKASGAWAQSIGLALHQLWRERAKSAEILNVGEKNQLSAKMASFTRSELLSLFRCEPWVEDILTSDKPHRAKEYWNKAIRKLRVGGAGIIGFYRELDPLPETRKGWEEFWLKYQRLDIRPRGADVDSIAKISRASKKALL